MAGSEGRADGLELKPCDFFHLNVGGWVFSVPASALARFGESVLWREVSRFPLADGKAIFLDQDGFVFRLVHGFLLTSQLSASCLSELDVLYEQTRALRLQPMMEALEKFQEGAPNLRQQMPPNMSVPEKATINYWKTRKCSSRLSELPLKSSLSSGNQGKAPLGLLDNPFLDVQEDVPYWFLPIDLLEKYPGLVTHDNLLWFSETFALIECGCQEVRFIGNFLHSGKFFLPEKFSDFDVLEAEIKTLGIPGLLQALHTEKKSSGYASGRPQTAPFSSNITAVGKGELYKAMQPFYILALELLAKYPDSALGQLRIESSVDGSKLYIIGSGTLFLHVKNWMGTCRLPLTRSFLEIYGLCTFLDRGDAIYQPMREAVRSYLRSRTSADSAMPCDSWTADVRAFPNHQTVKVYVRSHWYATYLKTLLKYPELLENTRKTRWITCGSSLLVNGDGEMFRHILNFLRLGSLYLPSQFREWDLLSQEVREFQIPSLVQALYECQAYRLWMKERVSPGPSEDPAPEVMSCISSTDLQDEGRPLMDEENPPASSQGPNQEKLRGQFTSPDANLTAGFPYSNNIDICSDYTADPIACLIKQVSEIHPTMSPRHKRPILASHEGNTLKRHSGDPGRLCHNPTYESSGYRGKMKPDGPTLIGEPPGVILVCEAIRQQKLLGCHNYSKSSQAMTQNKCLTPEDTTASTGGPGDLGAILWVQHSLLLATDGSATAFQDSVIYTTEADTPARAAGTAEDLFFLTFNMSHKEISYGRQCHSFLTGIILDCMQHEDPQHIICTVMRLVSKCWIFQIPVRQFVEDLMLLKFYKRKKSTRRSLQCWLEFSLPYARRYSQCIAMVVQNGQHRSASAIALRTILR